MFAHRLRLTNTAKHIILCGEILRFYLWWALTDSNRRPSACKADALNQLS